MKLGKISTMLLIFYGVLCWAIFSPVFSAGTIGTLSTVSPPQNLSKVKFYGMCGREIFPNTELCITNGTKTTTLWAFDSQALKCVTFQNCGRFPHSLNFFPSNMSCTILCGPTRLALTLLKAVN